MFTEYSMSRAHLAPCSGLRGRYELTSPQEVAHGLPAASGHHALATWLRLSRGMNLRLWPVPCAHYALLRALCAALGGGMARLPVLVSKGLTGHPR
jgi:hypothetical protein